MPNVTAMEVAIALHAASAVLLLLAGVAKVARPSSTADLLFSLRMPRLGFPSGEAQAVALGVVEIGLGIAALAIGGAVTAGIVGVFYVGFAAAVVRALMVGAPSCGCFGRAESPPTRIHVAGNVSLAAVSFIAIGGTTPLEVMGDQVAGGVGFVVLVGVLAGLFLVLFTALPEAMAARRPR
jgi:hypothetical protein